MNNDLRTRFHQINNQLTILSGKVRLAKVLVDKGDPQAMPKVSAQLQAADDAILAVAESIKKLRQAVDPEESLE